MENFTLNPGQLTWEDLHLLSNPTTQLQLDTGCFPDIRASEEVVQKILRDKKTVYGINTGFGLLAHTRISDTDLETLQSSIVLSHAAGVGELLPDEIVRLILLLKINSLARGFSGVRLETIETLITFFNEKMYPCIPSQGSVGASGDLAPLAHLSAALLGVGHVRYQNKIIPAQEALTILKIKPLKLAPKEGLALLNGTQASTAIAIFACLQAEKLFQHAITAGAMSVDAALGSYKPFDERIQEVRGHAAQIKVAKMLRDLLVGSEIGASHSNCEKVQDPYSLRCQPQVMGACLMHMDFVRDVLLVEANAVSDNPLIFSEEKEILSGGNFHAEPVAMAADTLALAISEIGALSERRIALLVDPHFSGLPAFLVENAGVNSGFMMPQVTAAALASENKSLAHPACVDSIPTSANQEDHVSMATYAAKRLLKMVENTAGIVAIELLAACQGIDFRKPLKTSPALQKTHARVREHVKFYDKDRFFAPDIAVIQKLVMTS